MKKGYLVLADGQAFQGFRFGAATGAVGELVFTTGMCGYVETLTDPSYAGQIVMQTYPLIGNYGVIPEDFEGDCHVKGYVVREPCGHPSNFRCGGDLDGFLKERNIPGLYGVGTLPLTPSLRAAGGSDAPGPGGAPGGGCRSRQTGRGPPPGGAGQKSPARSPPPRRRRGASPSPPARPAGAAPRPRPPPVEGISTWVPARTPATRSLEPPQSVTAMPWKPHRPRSVSWSSAPFSLA